MGLSAEHQEHYQSCGCLDDSAECCRPDCDCHPAPQPSSEGREADEPTWDYERRVVEALARAEAALASERAAREAAEQRVAILEEQSEVQGQRAEDAEREAQILNNILDGIHRWLDAAGATPSAEEADPTERILSLEQRIEAAEARADRAEQMHAEAFRIGIGWQDRATAAEAKLRTAVEALLFYAAYESWTDETIEFGSASAAVDSDDGGGNRARAALAAIRGASDGS